MKEDVGIGWEMSLWTGCGGLLGKEGSYRYVLFVYQHLEHFPLEDTGTLLCPAFRFR